MTSWIANNHMFCYRSSSQLFHGIILAPLEVQHYRNSNANDRGYFLVASCNSKSLKISTIIDFVYDFGSHH